MLGQISKHLERPTDSVLHRVRTQKGNERITTHGKDPPKGPRNFQNKMPRGPNGRPNIPMVPGMSNLQGGMGNGMAGPGGMNMNMTQQQQIQLMAMYEQQAQMMAQILSPQQQQQIFANPGAQSQIPGGPFPHNSQPQSKSLFDRVERPQRNENRGHNRGAWTGPKDTHGTTNSQDAISMNTEPTSSMEVEPSQGTTDGSNPGQTCRFNLSCSNKDCKYAHQSPAAPPGTPIDINDQCNFGAACKNKKCVANHPSPAQKTIHQADQDCKFFPNCTNPACPFKHPAMPLCRNGADCTREGCKFTHLAQKCKYNPCMNRVCPYKHDEGQRGVFADKVWLSGESSTDHLSERKFVDNQGEAEELIIPGSEGAMSTSGAELVT
jgi:hypothetical protein